VIYTAAHGGFAAEHAPLGGGAAVCDMLCAEWARTRPFEFELYTPRGVKGADITSFDTRAYARFCREFGQASTEFVQKHDPKHTAVLVNDISEGPDFKSLHAQGYKIITLWHVDVVAYFASMYAKGFVSPRTLVKLDAVLGWMFPEILSLIFDKQADCLEYSFAHFVPAPDVKQTILETFPHINSGKIDVLPWGAPPSSEPPVTREAGRAAFGIPRDAFVMLTLSRLSPEKNQQLLLDALYSWEQQRSFPSCPMYVLLCGAAAYMQGARHEAMLRAKAARLRKTKVIFAGHVYGPRKQEAFGAADLYVFPSKHESYGLTLMEAFQAGLPALTLNHAGAAAVMEPGFGAMTTSADFLGALQRLVSADLPAIGAAARDYAAARPFAAAAAKIAARLK
jgi:glycosyltransferase involved in cell wall biosynthesis